MYSRSPPWSALSARELEGRLRAYMRWNAMALVVRANRLETPDGGDLGGHISSF